MEKDSLGTSDDFTPDQARLYCVLAMQLATLCSLENRQTGCERRENRGSAGSDPESATRHHNKAKSDESLERPGRSSSWSWHDQRMQARGREPGKGVVGNCAGDRARACWLACMLLPSRVYPLT